MSHQQTTSVGRQPRKPVMELRVHRIQFMPSRLRTRSYQIYWVGSELKNAGSDRVEGSVSWGHGGLDERKYIQLWPGDEWTTPNSSLSVCPSRRSRENLLASPSLQSPAPSWLHDINVRLLAFPLPAVAYPQKRVNRMAVVFLSRQSGQAALESAHLLV
jgi:hypothetical protein